MKHHLICIEGLSANPFTGFYARYIANGLVPQLKTENVIVTIGGWNSLKLPVQDLWKTADGKRIIVGHSRGGVSLKDFINDPGFFNPIKAAFFNGGKAQPDTTTAELHWVLP